MLTVFDIWLTILTREGLAVNTHLNDILYNTCLLYEARTINLDIFQRYNPATQTTTSSPTKKCLLQSNDRIICSLK